MLYALLRISPTHMSWPEDSPSNSQTLRFQQENEASNRRDEEHENIKLQPTKENRSVRYQVLEDDACRCRRRAKQKMRHDRTHTVSQILPDHWKVLGFYAASIRLEKDKKSAGKFWYFSSLDLVLMRIQILLRDLISGCRRSCMGKKLKLQTLNFFEMWKS